MTRRRRRVLRTMAVVFCVATACGAVRGDWVILADGRAGKVVKREGDTTQIELADAMRRDVKGAEVTRRLSDVAFCREVDKLVLGLGRNSSRAKSKQGLEQLGAAAVDRIVFRINGSDKTMRFMALAALQYCWAPQAKAPVLAAMKDRDAKVRKIATVVAQRHLTGADLTAVLEAKTRDADANVAGPAIQSVEAQTPDLDRMLAAMARPALWPHIHQALLRYHSPKLTPLTLRALAAGQPLQKTAAIASLIHQQDASPATRAKIAGLLQSPHATVRDMAGEYLRWHGTSGEREALRARMKAERDPYCLASLAAAVEAIDMRARRFTAGGKADQAAWPDAPVAAYEAAIKALGDSPNVATQQRVVALLAEAEAFEPVYRYGDTKRGAAAIVRDETLMRLMPLVYGYPSPRQRGHGGGEVKSPAAQSLIAPVRQYFDPKRKSFGYAVQGAAGPFAGTVHIGDDVAWYAAGATVVAIGQGVVRQVRIGASSWGGIVIVEHAGADGQRFCSLYAHLGPLVCVRPGDRVRRGQKLGVVGRAHTWAGGGYRDHLHFAIHRGAFDGGFTVGQTITVRTDAGVTNATITAIDDTTATLKLEGSGKTVQIRRQARSRWITGYLSPEAFKTPAHGWVDPQEFIKARTALAAPRAARDAVDKHLNNHKDHQYTLVK